MGSPDLREGIYDRTARAATTKCRMGLRRRSGSGARPDDCRRKMSVFLALLGVAMMATGLAAIYSGSLFVGIERGWTMVVAGSIGFSAGAILLGMAAALRRLRRIERALKMVAGAAHRWPAHESVVDAEPAAPAADGTAPPEGIGEGASPTQDDAPAAKGGTTVQPDAVVGTYQAGGNAYVMYADGSIRADTPSGEHRFGSMDEFKAFMLTGTLRARAPAEPGKIAPPPTDQASDKPTALSAKA
jgi:hypothetical protein